jgi:hypothetical protein
MPPCILLSAMIGFFAPPTARIPAAGNFDAGDFDAAAKALDAKPWSMRQSWRTRPQEGFLPGSVRWGWQPDTLWVLADLPDKHIRTSSTAHNQMICTLGDTFEIFVGRLGTPWYLELHISPRNHRLHLLFPADGLASVKRRDKTLAEFERDPQAFSSWVSRSEGERWQVLVRVPASLLPGGEPFRAGDRLEVSFSRYDCGPEGTPDILSSTSPHRQLDFHRRHEWRRATLVASRP